MDHIKSEGKHSACRFHPFLLFTPICFFLFRCVRSYSGNSSPTPGTKAYRNNGTHRDRQYNSSRKSNYSKSMVNLPKSQSLPDRFLQRLESVELPKTAPDSLCNESIWDELSQKIWRKCVERQQTKETYRNKMRLWLLLNNSIEVLSIAMRPSRTHILYTNSFVFLLLLVAN